MNKLLSGPCQPLTVVSPLISPGSSVAGPCQPFTGVSPLISPGSSLGTRDTFLAEHLADDIAQSVGGDEVWMREVSGKYPTESERSDARDVCSSCEFDRAGAPAISSAPSTAWDSLGQQRRNLWKASQTGDAELLRAIFASPQLSAAEQPTGDTKDARIRRSSGSSKWLVNARSLHNRTAVHMASAGGHAVCVDMLLRAGADARTTTDAGFTALHLACQHGHLEVVSTLCTVGSDTLVVTDQGDVALHLAVASGHRDVAALLLERSGFEQLAIRNNFGQRPCDVCGSIETEQLLQGCGATATATFDAAGAGGRDTYAGRTVYGPGAVLLRNSRADAVRRLLQTMNLELPETIADGGTDSPQAADVAMTGPLAASSRPQSVAREHSKDAELAAADVQPSPRLQRARTFSKLTEEECLEEVGPQSFELKSVLGKGSFGQVYQVAHRHSGEVYAMKVLQKSKILSKNLLRYTMTERNLLSYIQHPFIVRLHYAFQTPSCLVLVLQYCPGGNLWSMVRRAGRLPEGLARFYLAEVLLAIEHLHERHVVYRDLKPENVLVDQAGHAMLTDFGLSKEGVADLQGTRSFCGSIAYLAPEILGRKPHGRSVDLYGLGTLLFELMAGQPPFYHSDRHTLFRNIACAKLCPPPHASPEAARFISALMQRDPTRRLGAQRTSDIRLDEFFKGMNFEALLEKKVSSLDNQFQRGAAPPSSSVSSSGSAKKLVNPFKRVRDSHLRLAGSEHVLSWEFASHSPSASVVESASNSPTGTFSSRPRTPQSGRSSPSAGPYALPPARAVVRATSHPPLGRAATQLPRSSGARTSTGARPPNSGGRSRRWYCLVRRGNA
jgi:protein-serine/threonine kinase